MEAAKETSMVERRNMLRDPERNPKLKLALDKVSVGPKSTSEWTQTLALKGRLVVSPKSTSESKRTLALKGLARSQLETTDVSINSSGSELTTASHSPPLSRFTGVASRQPFLIICSVAGIR